jgi:hypothetical protein
MLHTSFNSVVVGTTTIRIIAELFSDVRVHLTNASVANTVRIGPRATVMGGGGMPLPPGQVVPFTLRANTELWAAASASTSVGISIEEV